MIAVLGVHVNSKDKDEAKIKEALDRFDKDGNGEITVEELQNMFILVGERDGEGRFLSLDQVKAIIRRFDDNDDGVIQYNEFAQLWMARRKSAMSEESLRHAVVVCGYTEVGQELCSLIEGKYSRHTVSFSPLASTLYSEILKTMGASVIYEDGGKVLSSVSATFSYSQNYSLSFWSACQGSWLKKTTAIAITYDTFDRCLRVTACLQDAFPDTPIFVCCGESGGQKELVMNGSHE